MWLFFHTSFAKLRSTVLDYCCSIAGQFKLNLQILMCAEPSRNCLKINEACVGLDAYVNCMSLFKPEADKTNERRSRKILRRFVVIRLP
jgi:hypothetical protein